MSNATSNGRNWKNTYDATSLLRPSALQAGQRVVVVLGKDDTVGKEQDKTYVVTNETDKKGNPKLIAWATGEVVVADPLTVFALSD